MKKIILLLVIVAVSIVAVAHEFWFMPDKFHYEIGQTANIRLRVGEGFVGENWSGNNARIQQLVYYTPAGARENLSGKLSANKGDSLQLLLKEEGTHMVIFNSNNSFISQEADKFTEYLKEDGLDYVIDYRKQHQEENKKSTEHYQRSIKTLLQVGNVFTDACTQPTTLPLDIIPEKNPNSPPFHIPNIQEYPRFRVLFKGQPVINVLVRNWYYTSGNRLKTDLYRTNRKGWVTIRRSPGVNMVSCVYMEHTPEDKEAEWQSYWASVSFSYGTYFARSRPK